MAETRTRGRVGPADFKPTLEFVHSRLHLLDVGALLTMLNFLFPSRCASCGTRFNLQAARRVCAACLERVEPLPEIRCTICGGPLEASEVSRGLCARCSTARPRFGRAWSVARYRPATEREPGTLAAVIRRHKYGLDQSLGRALAEYLGEHLPFSPGDYDLVVPVPLHRRRLMWRGFNQAALLGAEVAGRLGCPLGASVLNRVRATPPQTSRDHATRRQNVRNAFRVRRPDRVRRRRVLIVDDVMTTGATVDECARALLAAGAARVDVFTLARAL